MKLREEIIKNSYDLSTIIVIENTPNGKFELKIDAKVYEDVKESIIVS